MGILVFVILTSGIRKIYFMRGSSLFLERMDVKVELRQTRLLSKAVGKLGTTTNGDGTQITNQNALVQGECGTRVFKGKVKLSLFIRAEFLGMANPFSQGQREDSV